MELNKPTSRGIDTQVIIPLVWPPFEEAWETLLDIQTRVKELRGLIRKERRGSPDLLSLVTEKKDLSRVARIYYQYCKNLKGK